MKALTAKMMQFQLVMLGRIEVLLEWTLNIN